VKGRSLAVAYQTNQKYKAVAAISQGKRGYTPDCSSVLPHPHRKGVPFSEKGFIGHCNYHEVQMHPQANKKNCA